MRTHTTRALALILIALSALATAQEADPAAPFRIAFVDTQALISAHPAQEEIARMGQALDAELQELLGQRDALLQKQQAQALTPEEQELLQSLQVTIQTRRDRGLQDIRQAAGPAEAAANEIIRDIAQQDGYALVMDIEAASGLVVFASEGVPDLTAAAVALMEERFPAE